MKKSILLLFLLFALNLNAHQLPVGIDGSLQLMQLDQQLVQTDQELNEKIGKRNSLETALHEIDSTLGLSKSLNFLSKVEKLKKDKLQVQNDLQQVEVDIVDLRKNKIKLIEYQKRITN